MMSQSYMSRRLNALVSARLYRKTCLFIAALLFSVLASVPATAQHDAGLPLVTDAPATPNFLVIVADDMGWSDLGVTGGEIRTPNLDALAARGLVMTNFYVAPTCAPTRSMLLTGVSNHEAGVGTQHGQQVANQKGDYRYAGELHDGVVTIAEALGSHGYQTWMTGKWHIGYQPSQYPNARGFDRSFTLREGGASHFEDGLSLNQSEPTTFLEDDVETTLPEGFYSTTSYTDIMLSYLEARDRSRPFFSYLAYTAPHDPLQVPDDWLDRYKGAYDDGPEMVQQQRLSRIRELGLFPEAADLADRLNLPKFLPSYSPPWEERSAEEQMLDARPMEIYASMIELMDAEIGRVFDYLESEGELDNTYVVFFSDNGSSASTPLNYPDTSREWLFSERDMRPESAGQIRSHTYLGRDWAQTSNTPWRFFKAVITDGGTRSPLIAAGPDLPAQGYLDSLSHISDIAPTLYDLAGIDPASDPIFEDKAELRGQSLLGSWTGESMPEDRLVFTELFGNKSVRNRDWKLIAMTMPFGNSKWELYNLASDPGEAHNIASEHPEIVAELSQAYERYAEEVGIIAPDPPIVRKVRATYVGECDFGCELRFKIAEVVINPLTRPIALSVLLLLIGFIGVRIWRR